MTALPDFDNPFAIPANFVALALLALGVLAVGYLVHFISDFRREE